MSESCRYCGGDCPTNENESCDGYQGDIDGLYARDDDAAPTLSEWLEEWAEEYAEGRTRISRAEAERRYHKQHPNQED